MGRILICTTILKTVKAFLIPHIQLLQKMGYIVDVAGYKDESGIEEIVDNLYDIPFQRNPFSKQNIKASRFLKEITEHNNYNIIHFHTPVASAFGRWVVKSLRKNGTKVIYTAHGFHFYKGAPLVNWALYYPVEKWLAKYTDVLITINNEDYTRAKKSFNAKRVLYIPGVGLNTKRFMDTNFDKSIKRRELGIPDDSFIILSVGELNQNKNHEVVIKSLAKIDNQKIVYMICGQGNQESYLKHLAISLNVVDRVLFLGFRIDMNEIYKVADVFVFPSYREGLSVSLMEAMSAGLPVVCSNIRGNKDLIKEGQGGYLVEPDDVVDFTKAINSLIYNKSIRDYMGYYNLEKVTEFDIENIINEMKSIYKIESI
jgi:glycosyltransferase involved in cell wall biosynthesis